MAAQEPIIRRRSRPSPAERTPTARGSGQSQSIAAVERALDVLLLFGRSLESDHGVPEIDGELGLSKAAVHPILTSLRSRGLISLDETTRRYALGRPRSSVVPTSTGRTSAPSRPRS